MLSAVSVATTLAFDVERTLAIDHKVTVQPVGSYREALWCIASVDQACSLAHHSLIDQLDTLCKAIAAVDNDWALKLGSQHELLPKGRLLHEYDLSRQ